VRGPLVLVDGIFAVKGDTAINLFVLALPRLSIDLDLVLPYPTDPAAFGWDLAPCSLSGAHRSPAESPIVDRTAATFSNSLPRI
jgi:hypothetical protein